MKLIVNLSQEQIATLQQVLNRPETVVLGQVFKDAETDATIRERLKAKTEARKVKKEVAA